MGLRFDGPVQSQQAPQMPNAFFDGTRLGLEATMFATLWIAIPAGLHIGLSATLGYAVRYAHGLPEETKAFAFFGFFFASLLAVIALAMAFFFGGAIPTMAYSMGLVAFMLYWLGKRRGNLKRTSIIVGSILGLLTGLLMSTAGLMLMGLRPTPGTYATMFHWPEIMTIDGIALLWFTLLPIATAAAGMQSGRKLGDQLETLTMNWYWY
jgi:hypothetical protein